MKGSGAAPAAPGRALENTALRASAPEHCADARKGVRYYQRQYAGWRAKMGAGTPVNRPAVDVPCPQARRMADRWREKARAARKAYERWVEYHYHWWKWMPEKHQRVARCETGYQGGTGPGGSRFDWDSGTYVSAWGIYRSAYNDDAHRIGNLGWDETKRKLGRLPTPREQMQAVDSHRAAHGGWSGWGCRGA